MARSPTDHSFNDSAGAVPIDSEERFDEVRTARSPVLVDFYADWCGPCQEMAEPIAELGAELDAPVLKVDVESLPQLAARYNVRSIPTILVFADGHVQERFVGVQEKSVLRTALEN